MAKFFKEPLVQFLIGGALLYAALTLFTAPEEGETSNQLITVNDGRLLTYMQYQNKAFDEGQAQRILGGLSEDARTALENEYIRDQIMVREALSLGLDQNDDVINERLIEKMEFVLQGFIDADETVSETELSTYFADNLDRYTAPAEATFTHVFYNTAEKDPNAALNAATQMLATLQSNNTPFEEARDLGDRFYFLKNYINRPAPMINDHFGDDAAASILGAENFNTWFGPLQSPYGYHLVMVNAITPAKTPALNGVMEQVREDLLNERRNEALREAFAAIAEKYTVQYSASE